MAQLPDDSFYSTFDPLRDLLVEALDQAYETVSETHNPEAGFNARTFGFTVYEVGVHELTALAEANPDELSVSWTNQAFRLVAGPYEIAVHRVGSSADDDIRSSFPNNDGAVSSMVFADYLPGLEPDLTGARKVVLAHMGNPDDGLCAVYVCIPVRHDAAGHITEWGFTFEILRRTDECPVTTTESREQHPEEVLEEVEVSLKKAAKRDPHA